MPGKIHEPTMIDFVDYSVPVYDEDLQIICSYNYTVDWVPSDLMDAYLEFHWSYYVSLSLTFFIFIFVWKICANLATKICKTLRDEIRNARLPSYWIMICAILDQDQFPNVSRIAFSTLSICFSLFFFILVDCFMMNIMRSDLATIEEPRVIRTYEDIVDRNGLEILFLNGMDEEVFFRDAEEGSIESKIWDKKKIIKSISPDIIGEVWQPVIDQRIIGIVRDWTGLSAANLGITKTRAMEVENIRAITTRVDQHFTNAFMIHKDAPPKLKIFMKEQ